MKIALVVEGSTKHHAEDVLDVLKGYKQHEVFSVGMLNEDGEESLTFLHTSVIAGILLNAKAVDFVVGGCGTGQGFINGVLAFPGVLCGLIYDPLEAWLFMRVNAGNCLSLPLNRGWGLAGKEQIRLIMNEIFTAPVGKGYPQERAEVIRDMHAMLRVASDSYRKSFCEIFAQIDKKILHVALNKKVIKDLIEAAPQSSERDIVLEYYKNGY